MKTLNRRTLIASGLAVGGGIVGLEARRSQLLNARLSRTRTSSLARDPLYVAMLDRHAARLQAVVPEIESTLNRRLSIEALPAEELYANYTIDLLQQTGRYDVVSMNDSWIPYFGRRGYLTEVPDLESIETRPSYPSAISSAAAGVDGTELVAYPWTFDFTCSAVRSDHNLSGWSESWPAFFTEAASSVSTLGVALGDIRSAAETFRAVLLSYGGELIHAESHNPLLDTYAGGRALETSLRLARLSNAQVSPNPDFSDLVTRAAEGAIDAAPVIWASDSNVLRSDDSWEMSLVPSGRTNREMTNASLWMWGVPAGAPSVSVARGFVQLMTSLEMQAQLWPQTGLLPATRPALNGTWDPGGNSMKNLALDAIDHSQFAPKLRSFRSVMQIVGQMVLDAVAETNSNERIRLQANEAIRTVLIQEGELKG